MKSKREWATPITAGAFLLSAVTGVLMFFHLDSGINKLAHEWLSWAFLLGAGFHLAFNFQAFRRHLASARARWLVGLFLAALCLSFVPLGGRQLPPFVPAMNAIAQAPLSAVAPLTGSSTEELIERLAAAGYPAASADARIADLAAGDRGIPFELIGIVFAGHEPADSRRTGPINPEGRSGASGL